mgnify:CR=1 FL=1
MGAAHPRACGENIYGPLGHQRRHGSSPRAGKTRTVRYCGRAVRAHPRACGENPVGSAAPSADCGSSPRVRGKRRQRRRGRSVLGLIPARAGKTRSCAPSTTPRTAHPRACGENLLPRLAVVGHVGSSPRVRGKQAVQALGGEPGGLIPARAGKTVRRALPAGAGRAHPRACGENEEIRGRLLAVEGSSPRVRGKPRRSGLRRRLSRLIPARAGKTNGRTAAARSEPAHPRACGENVGVHFCVHFCSGSSPRVRGKHRRHSSSVGEPGLIPARAGKTGCSSSNTGCPRAHPRACGENATSRRHARTAGGSSPRVRGKRPRGIPHRHPRGLIPARAGKTAPTRRRSNGSRAHPRACGENIGPGRSRRRARSSSPRVRGKRASSDRVRQPVGLIPARAGKTTVWSL